MDAVDAVNFVPALAYAAPVPARLPSEKAQGFSSSAQVQSVSPRSLEIAKEK